MKKTMLMLAAMLCCLMSLTSCGSDNDEPKENITVTGNYTITFSPDFFKVAKHVIISYKSDNGVNKTDVMDSGTTWTKTITSQKIPAELGYKITIEPKDENEIPEGTYELYVNGLISGDMSTGASFKTPSVLAETKTVTGAAKAIEWVNANKTLYYGFKFSKDGQTRYTPSF